MKTVNNIIYSQEHPQNCLLDIYFPESSEKIPAFIYYHGGGLEGGGRTGFDRMAEYLTDRGIAFISVDYRMYPSAVYPEFLIDAAEAVKYIIYEYSFSSVCVGGSSAGGYIAMMLYFAKEFFVNSGVDRRLIDGYLFDAGQPTVHYNVLKYDYHLDSRRILIDKTAPLYYLDHDFSKDEPYIDILCAENDMINRREQLYVLYTGMKHFGYPENRLSFKCFDGFTHCGYNGTEEFFERIAALVDKCEKNARK